MLIEVLPEQWYYILEDYDAPKNSNDWREHARAYGPFGNEDTAYTHLRNNHANPGSSSTEPYNPEWKDKKDPVLDKLIAEAPRNTRSRRRGW